MCSDHDLAWKLPSNHPGPFATCAFPLWALNFAPCQIPLWAWNLCTV
jgi:hypothetical protein